MFNKVEGNFSKSPTPQCHAHKRPPNPLHYTPFEGARELFWTARQCNAMHANNIDVLHTLLIGDVDDGTIENLDGSRLI